MYLEERGGGVVIKVLVQPRASRNEIVGIQGECLKIRIAAPPVEHRANEQLRDYLSLLIGVGKQKIELIGGYKGRNKKIMVTGCTVKEVKEKLDHLI